MSNLSLAPCYVCDEPVALDAGATPAPIVLILTRSGPGSFVLCPICQRILVNEPEATEAFAVLAEQQVLATCQAAGRG